MKPSRYDVVVVGGGSGGIGAALAAARMGRSTLLIERAATLGGTAVRGGVHVWQNGMGGTGIPFDIYRRLKRIPQGVAIVSHGRHGSLQRDRSQPLYPGGEFVLNPSRRYADTLLRHEPADYNLANEAAIRDKWHLVSFDPAAYLQAVHDLLARTQCCTVATGRRFTFVQARDGGIASLHLDDGQIVEADAFIDCTADGALCRACGCEGMLGQEPHDRFGEPSAPPQGGPRINGVTLVFRIGPKDIAGVDPLAPGVSEECWWAESFTWACLTQYPRGDWNVNVLPTMEGEEFLRLGYHAAYPECLRRTRAWWHWFQTAVPEYQRFGITDISPQLGVREGSRVVGEYVLSEHDLRKGLQHQGHDDIIAVADHTMDRHAQGDGGEGHAAPYGIPYRCLVPKGFRNLLIASRGASFSSIAASSCRLCRTVMQLGQAAGTAAAIAVSQGIDLPCVPAASLRDALRRQHVQLDWPMPSDLLRHVQDEDEAGNRMQP